MYRAKKKKTWKKIVIAGFRHSRAVNRKHFLFKGGLTMNWAFCYSDIQIMYARLPNTGEMYIIRYILAIFAF